MEVQVAAVVVVEEVRTGPQGLKLRNNTALIMLMIYRDLTRILKTGVRDSSKRKSRSPRQHLGVPL